MDKERKLSKEVSNPHSTGGSGVSFEAKVLAYFITIMNTGGIVPVFNEIPTQIISQAKRLGYNTDDIVVIIEDSFSQNKRKLLCQVKQSIAVTKSNTDFSEFIQGAWLDYNRSEFSKENDAIVLITGPLSKKDINGVLPLLDRAKLTKTTNEFMTDLKQKKFISNDVREKYDVIHHHVRCANESREPSDEEIHSFLRNIHILQFDLGGIYGMDLPIICSHLSQCCREPPKQVWDSILAYATTGMNYGSPIRQKDLPEDIRRRFSKITSIPEDLYRDQEEKRQFVSGNILALMIMFLIGSWDSNNEGDVEVIKKFVEKSYTGGYTVWYDEIKKMLTEENSSILFSDGIWTLNDRKLSVIIAKSIFDDTLKAFSEFVLEIANERDPALDLPPDQRFVATICGKNRKFSKILRRSALDGLAILANNKSMLMNCSESGKRFPEIIVSSIMGSITWERICSLNGLMQPLAETSPDVFLNCLENAIQNSSDMIIHVKEQESKGLFGQNYIQDVISALEALAWDPKYLSNVTSLLASLVEYYEDSNNYGPFRSLMEIFLPWNPNTTANVEKRMIAIGALNEENPNIAWKLLLNLLPGNHTTSFGTMHPIWMKANSTCQRENVSPGEYWDQVNQCTALAVDIGKKDPAKIPDLIKQMDNMPQNVFDDLIEIISSLQMSLLSDSTKKAIMNNLYNTSIENKKNLDAEWALSPNNLKKIDDLISQIESNDPHTMYVYLFSSSDHFLYESKDYEKEKERIKHQRIDVIETIINKDGIDGIFKFSNEVDRPEILGYVLGLVDEEYYASILPSKMSSCNDGFIKSYIIGRFEKKSWEWDVFSDIDSWDSENKVRFLYTLPFTSNVLSYVNELNDEDARIYWKNVDINPFELSQETYERVITSLLNVGRFYTSVNILSRLLYKEKDDGFKVDSNLIFKTLLFPLDQVEDIHSYHDNFDICELIKRVQTEDSINIKDKISIEWRYLDLMGDNPNDVRPSISEKELSQNPTFFCEIIRLIYKSEKEKEKSVSEEQASLAPHAYKLMQLWKIPPGIDDEGNFNIDKFKSWLQSVKDISNETGHMEVSMSTFGNVLIHVPQDKDGLWINKEVAKILNDEKSDDMRCGLYRGYVNSVGVYTPGNGFEEHMAEIYLEREQSAEKYGYRRLANCMKDVKEHFISLKEKNNLNKF